MPNALTGKDRSSRRAGVPAALFMIYYAQNTAESGSFSEPQSYVYNGAVLGCSDMLGRLRGQANRVPQPALTMFAAVGVHGNLSGDVPGYGTYTLFNNRPLQLRWALQSSETPKLPTTLPALTRSDIKGKSTSRFATVMLRVGQVARMT